jgi:hypothetical protein
MKINTYTFCVYTYPTHTASLDCDELGYEARV